MSGGLDPWQVWLLSLARRGTPPAGDVPAVDWQTFAEKAGQHQMNAFCYACLRHGARPQTMPEPVWENLRFEWFHQHMRNIRLFTELQELHAALDTAGLDHLFAKGPWLAFAAWPESGARPVGDIDLIVQEKDVRAVWQVLLGLGYRAESPCPEDGAEALAFAHYRRQYRFFASGRRPLELHFRMVNLGPPSSGEPWLWQGRRPAVFPEGVLPVPDATAMLFHLLLHANQHSFAVLRLFLDIRFHLEHAAADIDREQFHALTRRYRLGCSFFHTLRLAHHLTGVALPESLLPPTPGFLSKRRFAFLWSPHRAGNLALPRTPERFEAPKLYLAEMATWSDAWRYARGVARGAGGWKALCGQVLGMRAAGEVRP